MATLTIELPEGVLSSLHQSPGDAEKDVRLAIAIEWYRRGAMSQGRAAEFAGVPRADFIDALAARKIDVFQVDLDELRREIELE
jgi:predicted HTH domain antitoxin